MNNNEKPSALWQSICDCMDKEREETYRRISQRAEKAELYLNVIREARKQVLEIIDLIDAETNNPDWIKLQNTPIGKLYFKINQLENHLCW
mgnify:CR=1 FL=1